jgi:hypothetical protein
MVSALRPFARLGSPRGLLAMSLVLGSLSTVAGRGTFAYLSSNIVSQPNTFSGGVVDIAGLLTGTNSTASVLTTNIFSWDAAGARGLGSSGAGLADCTHINTASGSATDITNQKMTPGHYCVARVDLNNTNTNSVDAWIRLRVVRSTAVNAGATAEESAAIEALNDRLKFYMHEYTGGASASANQTARNTDCTTANFKPTWSGPSAVTASSGTYSGVAYDWDYVPGTSSGKILQATASSVTRTPLTTIGDIGKNLGAHPGVSAVVVNQAGNTTSLTKAAQDPQVLALVDASAETAVGSPASKNGLRLRAGTSASGTTTDAAPTEGNMVSAVGTTGLTRNSYNLVGNDEVTNPVKTTAGTINGTEAHGTNTEATLAKGASKYYCVAIFFPIDTDQSLSTAYATTASVGTAAGFGRTIPASTSFSTGALAQYTNCAEVVTATAACLSLGDAAAAMTAQNGKGDNAAAAGNVKYYLTVSAAQQAGRTVAS